MVIFLGKLIKVNQDCCATLRKIPHRLKQSPNVEE